MNKTAKLPDRRWRIELNSDEALDELIERTSIKAGYKRKFLHVVDLIRANRRYPHAAAAVKGWREIASVMRAYIRMKRPWSEVEGEYQKAVAIYWECNARYISPLARMGTDLEAKERAAKKAQRVRMTELQPKAVDKRREKAAWREEWFRAAHEKQPELGPRRLADEARALIVNARHDHLRKDHEGAYVDPNEREKVEGAFKRRNEITRHTADAFLKNNC